MKFCPDCENLLITKIADIDTTDNPNNLVSYFYIKPSMTGSGKKKKKETRGKNKSKKKGKNKKSKKKKYY